MPNWGMSLKPISPKPTSLNAGRDFGIHGYFNANRNEGTTANPLPQIDATEDYMRELVQRRQSQLRVQRRQPG